jgi:hypothetical protein
MRAVILCRDLDSLVPCLPPPPEAVQYLILRESQESLNIRAYLERRGAAKEMSRPALFRKQSAWFRSEYVKAIGQLNVENAGRDWWATRITTKNPISTELCRDTFAFLLIVDLMRRGNGILVVVSDSRSLAEQVQAWGKAEGVAVTNAVNSLRTLRMVVSRFYYPGLLLRVARLFWYKLRMGFVGKDRALADEGCRVLIVTVVHPHSFTAEGRFHDTYFGQLCDWLISQGIPVVTAGIIEDRWNHKLARTFIREGGGPPKILYDAGVRLRDICRCAWEAIQSYRTDCSRKLAVVVGGLDIGYLVDQAVRKEHTSCNVFWSLYTYHSARRLGPLFPNARPLHPYENRAWEKMHLLGFREISPNVQRVGYQHASITASHTNFIFTDKETEVTPLPDVIVTMGQITRDWLEREGHHPPSLLKVGCALRQQRAEVVGRLKRRPATVSRILVALATSLNEYIQTLLFLRNAMHDGGAREVRIRPHPTIRLEDAMAMLSERQPQLQFTVSRGSVAEDLVWADVVLYASSTIGLETVWNGIPAIYLDLGDILETDPMAGWTEFKWVVRDPEDLRTVLADIEGLSDAEYQLRQQQAVHYGEAYIRPVTEENLRVFCEA